MGILIVPLDKYKLFPLCAWEVVDFFRFLPTKAPDLLGTATLGLSDTWRIAVDKAENEDWQLAENICQTAIQLAQSVGSKLEKGASAHSLLALLRHELQLATHLRLQINRINPEATGFPSQRDRLARKLRELADLEDHNHRLLSRRGVLINGPGMYR